MKTSEFLSIFDSNVLVCPIFEVGEVGVKELTHVKIYDSPRLQDSRELAKVWVARQGVALTDEMAKYPHLVKAIMEYYLTPLEEREEEKKYHLRFPKGYNSWYNYLAKEINKDNGEYDCSGKCIDNEKYKNIFTQEEIDAMPFDTNFFIKEEVK